MRKFGPLVFQEDYENEEEDISSFGPTIAKGSLTVRSVKTQGPLNVEETLTADFIKTNGPLDVGGALIAEELKVNGPAVIDGSVQIVIGQINGSFKTQENVTADDSLKINGPIKAKAVNGGFLRINGLVDVGGPVVATDEIIIGISSRLKKNPIRAQLLKAPFVEIRGRETGFLGRIFSRFASKRPASHDLAEINVPIEAEEVVLDGVRHTGLITAKSIILENEAEYLGDKSS